MVTGWADLGAQVARARTEGPQILEACFRTAKASSAGVKAFQLHFLTEARPWWHGVYARRSSPDLGYYRKDSYLLADAPFLLRPTTAIIQPYLQNETATADYYGVGVAGLRILAEGGMTWFSALHPSAYENGGAARRFVDELHDGGHAAVYTDALEDALAAYWARNRAPSPGPSGSGAAVLDAYRQGLVEHNFAAFRQVYAQCVAADLRQAIGAIPEVAVELHAGLRYANLRDAAADRLLKLCLWNECMQTLGAPSLCNPLTPDRIVRDLHTLRGDQAATASYVFTAWQNMGASWSYAMGNTVDVSHRDLDISRTEYRWPALEDDQDMRPCVSLVFPQLLTNVLETNIDATASTQGEVEGTAPSGQRTKREGLLSDFAARAGKLFGRNDPYWMLEHSSQAAATNNPEALTQLYGRVMNRILDGGRDRARVGAQGAREGLQITAGHLAALIGSPLARAVGATGLVSASIKLLKGAGNYLRFSVVGAGLERSASEVRWASRENGTQQTAYPLRTIALPYVRNDAFARWGFGDLLPPK